MCQCPWIQSQMKLHFCNCLLPLYDKNSCCFFLNWDVMVRHHCVYILIILFTETGRETVLFCHSPLRSKHVDNYKQTKTNYILPHSTHNHALFCSHFHSGNCLRKIAGCLATKQMEKRSGWFLFSRWLASTVIIVAKIIDHKINY